MHQSLINEHGGAIGVRAGGDALIDSALQRPPNRFAYDPTSDLPTLAAAYLFGLAMNHGFVDGNKRVTFAAATTFLSLNGMRLMATEVDAYDAVMSVAAGRTSEEELAAWFRENSASIRR